MKYILVIVLWGAPQPSPTPPPLSPAVASAEFETEEACREAGANLYSRTLAASSNRIEVVWSCEAKGARPPSASNLVR